MKNAFTLIELLMVIVVVAILIGISSPAFMGMGRGAGMNGAVASVRSTLQLLRQWAITHRENVSFVYFKGGDDILESYYFATNAAGFEIISTNYLDKYNGSPRLPLDVMFVPADDNTEALPDSDKGGHFVIFKSDGGIVGGWANISIYDRKSMESDAAAGNIKKTIVVNGLTGGMRVE